MFFGYFIYFGSKFFLVFCVCQMFAFEECLSNECVEV